MFQMLHRDMTMVLSQVCWWMIATCICAHKTAGFITYEGKLDLCALADVTTSVRLCSNYNFILYANREKDAHGCRTFSG